MVHSIRLKIILALSVLVASCAITFLLLSMREHKKLYHDTVMSSMESLSNNLAEDLVPLLGTPIPDSIAITTRLLSLEAYKNVTYAIVFNHDRENQEMYVAPDVMEAIANGKKLELLNIEDIPLGTRVSQEKLLTLKSIGDTDYILGYLLIVADYDGPLSKANRELLLSSLPTGSLVLLVMVVVIVSIIRLFLKPLVELANFASGIESRSSYSQRFEYKGRDNEMAYLSEKINEMLERIQEESSKNIEYTNQLKYQQNALSRLANFDTLTGLPNRKYFNETLSVELSKARRNGGEVMLLFLDLDHFKSINDTLGHEVGDALLVKVSELTRAQLRDSDCLCRLGGDEFTIIVTEPGDDEYFSASTIAERVIRSLEKPIKIQEWDVQTGVSIGIADAKSAGYSPQKIISNADLAMYRAKESGRNNFSYFEANLQTNSVRKMNIANALATAVEKDEFIVHYQLKVDVNGNANGAEALLRWNSDFDGFISPGEFIPIAEHSGRIPGITRWLIRKVFFDMAVIASKTRSAIKVSLNLSAIDIKSPGLLKHILDEHRRLGVNPELIEFEVTESAYLDNLEEADSFFSGLRKYGFSIALDDFGTGYSSLSYLTRVQLNTLKIDKSFVDRMLVSEKDKMIVEAIVNLAHKLNLKVCAEGVETAEQRDFLSNMEIEQMQGYFFAKPMDLENVLNRISEMKKVG